MVIGEAGSLIKVALNLQYINTQCIHVFCSKRNAVLRIDHVDKRLIALRTVRDAEIHKQAHARAIHRCRANLHSARVFDLTVFFERINVRANLQNVARDTVTRGVISAHRGGCVG